MVENLRKGICEDVSLCTSNVDRILSSSAIIFERKKKHSSKSDILYPYTAYSVLNLKYKIPESNGATR